MKRRMTEAEIDEQLALLATPPNDAIDTTDIPEAPAKNWASATRPDLYRPLKRHIAFCRDANEIARS